MSGRGRTQIQVSQLRVQSSLHLTSRKWLILAQDFVVVVFFPIEAGRPEQPSRKIISTGVCYFEAN